jgi:hypothetical protein
MEITLSPELQIAIIAVAASLCAWLLALAANALGGAMEQWRVSKPDSFRTFTNALELGRAFGEQLMEKHGYTDKSQVEADVLKFVNQYMIERGFQPKDREFTIAFIRAIVRQYHEENSLGM